ncbi:MAG: hypothetical protein AAFY20_15610 [Cyanobacteria bacterium J06639_14]
MLTEIIKRAAFERIWAILRPYLVFGSLLAPNKVNHGSLSLLAVILSDARLVLETLHRHNWNQCNEDFCFV